jgi:WD40 repeat protein/HYR domain-containing protein
MRLLLLLSLVVLVTFQTACERDAATAPQVPLGPAAQAVSASNVPSRITFSACGPCSDIFVVGADGTGRTRLTSHFDFEPSFSADGRQIAFSRWVAGERNLANIFVMAADGSGLTELEGPAFDAEPSWSPDGRQIAFVSMRDGNNEIYVMNADGSAQTRLTNDPAPDATPSWSPDGRQIAFARGGDIYVMAPDGSGVTRVTDHPAFDGEPTWSPDGRQIVFRSDRDGNAEIYVMGADGSAPTRLTNHPAFDGVPSWSPIGLIAFQSHRDGPARIYVMNTDGSDPRRVTSNPFPFSPDSRPRWGPWLDQTPPQLALVSFALVAERWFGRVVGVSQPRPVDDFDLDPELTCTPPAGNVFPIGTTEVPCTTTDNAGNTASGSFHLTIRGPYEELGEIAGTLRGLIAGNVRDGRGTARLGDALTKVEAAREEFARTPPDRSAALGDQLGVMDNLAAAVTEGELSNFGFNVLAPQVAHVARLAADQAIAEAEARGGNAAAIAEAQDALAKGDAKRAAREFSDAVAQYRKACSIGLTA